jgi:mannosyltransferase
MKNIRHSTQCVLKEKRIPILLALVILVGFFLRLYRLGAPSLWFDEISTAGRIDYPLSQIIKNLFNSPFPPLYYTFMHLWVNIFGISEITLRFPSLLFSTLSIFFIFKIAKELYDDETGLISALLLSVSPYSINYAQEAKMYSLLWLLGILSFYYFFTFTRDYKNKDLFLYILFTTLSIYTLYVGFLFIIVHNILYFVFFPKEKLNKWLLGQLSILVFYLPWMSLFLSNALKTTGIGWIPKTQNYFKQIGLVFSHMLGIIFNQDMFIKYLLAGLYGFLAISALVPFKYKHGQKGLFLFTKSKIIILIWMMVPIFIFLLIDILITPILFPRYVGFIHIPLFILLSRGTCQLNLKTKYVLLGSLLLIIFLGLLRPYYHHNLKLYHQDWRNLFNLIRHRKTDKNILVVSRWAFFNEGAKYYNHDQKLGWIKTEEIEQNWMDKNYESIFFLYLTTYGKKVKEPPGYHLYEDYNDGEIGFLWFKKIL